jgi:hypothetical protein
MPDTQPSPQHSVAANELAERDVMYLLTDDEGQRHWSEKEIGDEIEDRLNAADILRALERAGLIHRTTDGFVFAARPAIRFRELIGGAFV